MGKVPEGSAWSCVVAQVDGTRHELAVEVLDSRSKTGYRKVNFLMRR
jgi:hypothetical protein